MRAALPRLVLALAAVALGGARLSSGADETARVRFPADPGPRNDIQLENRVPIRMRDGVTLYADVYRPVGDGKYPVLISRTAAIP